MTSKQESRGPSAEPPQNTHKYQFISYQIRKKLIEMVFERGFTVYRAAKLLNLNQSTAKAIARKYRSQGTIFRRKQETEERGDISPRMPQLTEGTSLRNRVGPNPGFVRVAEPVGPERVPLETYQQVYLVVPLGNPPGSTFPMASYPFRPMI